MKKALEDLTVLLAQTGLTVYAEGCVPENASLPYLVYSFRLAPFPSAGTVTVHAWFAEGTGNAERAAFGDTLTALIPEAGLLYGTGRLWVRADSLAPEKSRGALGLKAVLKVVKAE